MTTPTTAPQSHSADSGLTRLPAVSVEGPPEALGLVARESIAAGAVILHAAGVVRDTPSRYSLQIGESAHLDPPPEAVIQQADSPEEYLWRYLNHSCRPNAAFDGTKLVALRTIHAGDPITFNYNTTELDISSPFSCQCGACDGVLIRGFSHLSPEEQRELPPHIAAHLVRHRASSAVSE